MFRNPLRASILLVVASFGAGYSNSGYADEPAPCDQYECKEVWSYWTGTTSKLAYQYHDDPGLVITKNALLDVFTTQSKYNSPITTNLDITVWDYSYDQCIPWCGKDGAGAWQALQEVVITEQANKSASPIGKNANLKCEATENDGPGRKNANPVNKNTGGNTPPMGISDLPPKGGK